MSFTIWGAYERSTDVNQIAAVYEKYRENPETAYLGCSMGIIYRDPEDSYYDEAEFAIVKGNTVFGNLMDDVRFYGELAKDIEPMVYVNYCEKSDSGKPRCQRLSDLDSKTVEQDKAWYADRNPNTNEPKTTAQMFFTVYYAEKGDKMLHHFQGKIDIGTGNGGIISQLKMQNEMKLTDESWISYQQGKGNGGKEKKPSIHERLEINKRIIQEKQGKDKPERGADLSVRTVQYKIEWSRRSRITMWLPAFLF